MYCIELPDGSYGYCVVIKQPDVVFLDRRSETKQPTESVLHSEKLFRVFVMNSCFKSKHWSYIGNIKPRPDWNTGAKYYRRDAIRSSEFSIYDSQTDTEVKATRKACRGLEEWAVWSDVHIESRLLDQLTGGSARKYGVMQ